ncbi:MAG: helix-turn-helix transcriptional regulator [Pseudomonadota bacterium]|nr:helix-turn-helix transcriptional regulator [Pseudomonadota bacterium]
MKKQRQSAASDTPPKAETEMSTTAEQGSEAGQKIAGYVPPEAGIGERIRKRRAEIQDGLSVEDLSRLCRLVDGEGQGVSKASLHRYESGQAMPGAREIRILCDALDVSANWLMLGAESKEMHPKTSALAMLLQEWAGTMARDIEFWNKFVAGKKAGDMVWNDQIRRAKNPPKT